MTRSVLFLIILLSLVSASCSSRKKKLDQSNMIPRKELSSILADLYITDGLMSLPKVRHMYTPSDTLSAYKEVLEKHGYTKEMMDKTISYYFIKKPNILIEIYDQVLGKLSEMETRYEKEASLTQIHVLNNWTGDSAYTLPAPAGDDSTFFSVAIINSGIYTFSFTATLFPDDQSVSPKMTAYVCHPDSLTTGKKKYLNSIYFIKDGQPHQYSTEINCSNRPVHLLRGTFYDIDNFPDAAGKHLIIENISYTYTSGTL